MAGLVVIFEEVAPEFAPYGGGGARDWLRAAVPLTALHSSGPGEEDVLARFMD